MPEETTVTGGVQREEFNKSSVKTFDTSYIKTYGALLLPFDITEDKPQTDKKEATKFTGKLKSALKKAGSSVKNAIKNPTDTFKNVAKYMKDNRVVVQGAINDIGSKFSGIAVTQAVMNGKVTAKEATDYLFMGFAPALGVSGSLLGYSGLNQMKEALTGGKINVGSFVNGFSKTLKGATDLKDYLSNKEDKTHANVLEFDLTLSHSENYQSETPDRRVQWGQSLEEYVHNMPETFEVECALQEGKRYSKAEFRAIMVFLRDSKKPVSLVLGDEVFDNLILTAFNPKSDCTKSGMDYTLSFKKIYRSDIEVDTEVNVQKLPSEMLEDSKTTDSNSVSGSSSGSSKGTAKQTSGGDNYNVGNTLSSENIDPSALDMRSSELWKYANWK
jgi:hypothetical protein